MSELGVESFSWRSFYQESERGILIAFSIFAFLAILILRFFRHVDLVSFVALAAIVAGWLMVVSSRKLIIHGRAEAQHEVRRVSARVLAAISVAALGSFFAISAYYDDIVFSSSQYKSTLTQPVLFYLPVFNDISSVPIDMSQTVTDIPITTADGINLSCFVRTFGMVFDTRNIASLEARLTGDNMRPSPRAIITADLQQAIRTAAITAFSHKDSASMAVSGGGNDFVLQYAIGTPLGDTLAASGMRWLDGSLNYGCSLIFNS